MTILYPSGYSGSVITFDQMVTRHGPKMHPEFRRRFFAMITAGEGIIGVGGGWRSTEQQAANYAKDPKTFAPPGSSFHESQTFASGIVGYQAIDTVGHPGKHEQAWSWMRNNEARFGLRSFWNVNNEPWHVQCSDIPLGVPQWKNAGRPDPSQYFVLPDLNPPPPPPPPPEEDDMQYLAEPYRSYDSRVSQGQLATGVARRVPVAMGSKAFVNITCITQSGYGWVSIGGTEAAVGKTSLVNFESVSGTQVRANSAPIGLDAGWMYIKSTVPCHVVVDVFAFA